MLYCFKLFVSDSQSTINSKHIYLIATLYTYKLHAYLIVINSIAVCLYLSKKVKLWLYLLLILHE